TRNLAIDSIRVRRGVPTDPEDRVFVELMSTARLPDAAALASENVSNIRSALGKLPVDQRRAVLLAALYGRTALQISEGEGIPLGTAKSRIRLGMARLRTTINIEEAL
ncbi:MAG TPA: RNA polymerase sigma factor, partial [Acidimicrobiales bacterium]